MITEEGFPLSREGEQGLTKKRWVDTFLLSSPPAGERPGERGTNQAPNRDQTEVSP